MDPGRAAALPSRSFPKSCRSGLILSQETTFGMTRELSPAGSLLEDWVVFHVDDLEASMNYYHGRGVVSSSWGGKMG